MANEITTTVTLSATKGSLVVSRTSNVRADMAGTTYAGSGFSVPTTSAGTALGIGSIGTTGLAYFRNLDLANYVEIGVQVSGTFYPLARLKPGESSLFRLAINAPYARANTAPVVLDYTILEA